MMPGNWHPCEFGGVEREMKLKNVRFFMKFPKVGGKRAFSGFGACQGTTCKAMRARATCGVCCGGAWVLVWY